MGSLETCPGGERAMGSQPSGRFRRQRSKPDFSTRPLGVKVAPNSTPEECMGIKKNGPEFLGGDRHESKPAGEQQGPVGASGG